MLRWIQCWELTILTLFASSAFASTGYIDTPDECYVVEKAIGTDIYLKAAGPCNGHPGRAYVEASGSVKVYVDGNFWKDEETTELAIPDISQTMKNSEDISRTIVVLENLHKEEMGKEAGKLNDTYNSPGFQETLSRETERQRSELFNKPLEDCYSDTKKSDYKKEAAGNLPQDERIYLFISSSMPMTTVRNFIASVARFKERNIIVVLRGLVNGMKKIGPTIQFTADALKVDPLCSGANCEMYSVNIVVDPLLFRRYAISQVPAVVHAKGVHPSSPEESEGLPGTSVASSTTVYGDASLEYILDLIRRETGSKSLESLLAKR
jgi:type-F conjugative transfer system pilin assembly protein TrbC